MAFSHGKDAALWLNGVKISAFLRSIGMNPTVDLHDSSVFEMDDKTYIAGLEGSTINADGLYDGTADAIDEILNDLLGDPPGPVFTYLPQGDGFGNRMKSMVASVSNHTVTTPANDLAAVHLEATSNVGHESGIVLHASGAETATGDGTSVDQSAGSSAGASAYLHVSAGSPDAATLDVKVQHSTDDAVWVDLITFAQVAGTDDPAAQRGSATGTINRYVRTTRTIAGTSPSFTYLVAFHRK